MAPSLLHGLRESQLLAYRANGGETAVLYCFAFLYIFFHGLGLWSPDVILFVMAVRQRSA